MADNNKNPRRTIWLSETEPLSHYDIWLSKNQHLNSDGQPVLDSGVQRPCDYIFKVWDCDNWYPIVGLNSTALNKINTVKNQGYNSTNPNTGHTISSYSYEEFHLPLFTKPASSPSELFDAGTLGGAILEYVTEAEWKNIFEGDAFSYAFKWYIEEGDTNIDLLIDPAEADVLGGIYADEFEIGDIFPDSITVPSTYEINASYDWLAQAKYRLGYKTGTPEDYNLYISAKDIISAINAYTTSNPSAPSLSIPWATTETCGGILADVHRDSPNEAREAGVWVRFVPQNTRLYDISYGLPIPEHHLAITGEQLIKAINEETHNHPENPGIDVGGGSTIDPLALYNSFYNSPTVLKGWSNESQSAQKPRFELAGSRMPENRGKVPMLRNDSWWNTHGSGDTNYTEIDNALEWIDPYDPSQITVTLETILKNTASIGWSILHTSSNPTISPEIYGINNAAAGKYLRIKDPFPNVPVSGWTEANCAVEWVDVPDTWRPIQINSIPITEINTLNIAEGSGVTIETVESNGITIATISATSTPSPITITEGEGIDIEHTDSDYKVGIDIQNVSDGQVLSYDATQDKVKWVTLQPGTSYTAGTGVQIDQNTIKSEVLVDSNQRIAQQSIKFECGEDYIRTTLDNNTTFPLEPFNYTFIECGDNSDIRVDFTINTQKDCMKGDPVFVELDLSKANSTTVSFGNNMKYIDIGTSITGNSFKNRHVLITMQFGIVKIEGITTVSI